jgi:hypothetical protein
MPDYFSTRKGEARDFFAFAALCRADESRFLFRNRAPCPASCPDAAFPCSCSYSAENSGPQRRSAAVLLRPSPPQSSAAVRMRDGTLEARRFPSPPTHTLAFILETESLSLLPLSWRAALASPQPLAGASGQCASKSPLW